MSELCQFTALFPTTSNEDLAVIFGRTYNAIACLAYMKGLKKSSAVFRSISIANIKKAQEANKIRRTLV